MHSKYLRTMEVEARAKERLKPWLAQTTDGHLFITKGGPKVKTFQIVCGDVGITTLKQHTMLAVELKSERCKRWNGKTGSFNFFMETWSDFRTRQEGWVYYCTADLLIYFWLDVDEAHVMNWGKVQRWLLDKIDGRPRFLSYPESIQTQTKQPNETRGRLVPITEIARHFAPNAYGVFSPGHYPMALGDGRESPDFDKLGGQRSLF